DLRDELKDKNATFAFVYLVDDFTGSGKTLLRYDAHSKKWKGKLAKFSKQLSSIHCKPFDAALEIHVHHHLASQRAVEAINHEHQQAANDFDIAAFKNTRFSYGMVLPSSLPVLDGTGEDSFLRLCDKYY